MGRVGDWLAAGVFLLVVAPFMVLPHRWTVAAFGAIGRVGLPLTPFRRRIETNLRHVRGSDEGVRSLTAEVGDNFGRVLAEYVQMATLVRRHEARNVSGMEHLRAAMAGGRGAILVSAHYGSWEAVRLAARDAGVEVGIIYRAFNNTVFDRAAAAKIRLAGEPVMRKGAAGRREMLRHLRGGGVVLILLDQRLGDGARIPFMGRPAQTALAVAEMATRLRIPMLPAHGRRRADGVSFDVVVEPPLPPADAQTTMRAVNARYESWIAEAPGQWFWLHRRWKGAGG